MNKKEITEIVEILTEHMGKANLSELEVETEDFRIKLAKETPVTQTANIAPTINTTASSAFEGVSVKSDSKISQPGKIIKSPIVGTFYAASAPGKPAFVSVGSSVSKGSVVCIVESMKLMNEITSEFDGIIAEIYVSDGQAVEYDQPLFRLGAV